MNGTRDKAGMSRMGHDGGIGHQADTGLFASGPGQGCVLALDEVSDVFGVFGIRVE